MLGLKHYGHFGIARWSKIRIFWSKPLKIEFAIKSRVVLCFHWNFDTSLMMMIQRYWKNKITKILNFDSHEEILIFPDFPNFRPKFPDQDLIIYFKSYTNWKPFTIAFYWHQNHDHSNSSSKDINIQSQHVDRPCCAQKLA